LLEEFDNNAEMVSDLLKEENSYVEVPQNKTTLSNMSTYEKNKILKKALLSLNRKFVEVKKELEVLAEQKDRFSR
jgi:DNA topoisomerase VI subunit A